MFRIISIIALGFLAFIAFTYCNLNEDNSKSVPPSNLEVASERDKKCGLIPATEKDVDSLISWGSSENPFSD